MEVGEKSQILNSPNVDITIDPRFGENCIHFKFKERFSKEASVQATEAWTDEFERNPDLNYTQIWDCSDMKDFEYSARDEWMQTLSKYSNRIKYVSVVSDSVLIRGAARLMSKFSRLDLRTFKSIDELYNSHL